MEAAVEAIMGSEAAMEGAADSEAAKAMEAVKGVVKAAVRLVALAGGRNTRCSHRS